MKLHSISKMLQLDYQSNQKNKQERQVRIDAAKGIFNAMVNKIIRIDLKKYSMLAEKDDTTMLVWVQLIISQTQLPKQLDDFFLSFLNIHGLQYASLYFEVQKQVMQFLKFTINNQSTLSSSIKMQKSFRQEQNYVKREQRPKLNNSQNTFFQTSSTQQQKKIGLNTKLEASNYNAKEPSMFLKNHGIKHPFYADQSSISILQNQQGDSYQFPKNQHVQSAQDAQLLQEFIQNVGNYNSEFNQFKQQMALPNPLYEDKQQGKQWFCTLTQVMNNTYTKFKKEVFMGNGKGVSKKNASANASKELLRRIISKYPLMLRQYKLKLKKNLKTQ